MPPKAPSASGSPPTSSGIAFTGRTRRRRRRWSWGFSSGHRSCCKRETAPYGRGSDWRLALPDRSRDREGAISRNLGIIVGIIVGIVVEGSPGERRVAMVPSAISVLNKTGVELLMQPGAGGEAGFPDAEYVEKGVRLAGRREEGFCTAEVILQRLGPGAKPEPGAADLAVLREGQKAIRLHQPLTAGEAALALAERRVPFLAMEMM